MRHVSKVIVSDVEYKHATALIKDIKSSYPNVHITGQVSEKRSSIFVSKLVDKIFVGPLEQALENDEYEIIIPVSGRATQLVSKLETTKVFLASEEKITSALDKYKLATTCDTLGMKYPKTQKLKMKDDIKALVFHVLLSQEMRLFSKFDTVYIECAKTFDDMHDQIEKLLTDYADLILQERVGAKNFTWVLCLCAQMERFYVNSSMSE